MGFGSPREESRGWRRTVLSILCRTWIVNSLQDGRRLGVVCMFRPARALLLFTAPFVVHPAPARADEQQPLVPLAYVRTLAVAPAVLTTASDAPPPPQPHTADKKLLAQWRQRRALRERFAALRIAARDDLTGALVERLTRLSGLSIVPAARDVRTESLLRLQRR